MDGPCLEIFHLKPQKRSRTLKKLVILSVYNFRPDGVSIRTATVNEHNPAYNLKVSHIKTVYEINIAVSTKEKYAQRRPKCILFVF